MRVYPKTESSNADCLFDLGTYRGISMPLFSLCKLSANLWGSYLGIRFQPFFSALLGTTGPYGSFP